ncbi:MAG: SpoIIE family protein phosphatase [Sporichthyaceae bacterium]
MTASVDRRLRAVEATGLRPEPDATFDALARAACSALRVPISLVSLLDVERQFFPGSCGMPSPMQQDRALPLTETLCRMVVDRGEPLVFGDGPADPRVADNLMVAEFGVVAYIGLPLTDDDGLVLGSLCVVDLEARDWTEHDRAVLGALAEACCAELRLRTERTRSDAAAARAARMGELAAALALAQTVDDVAAVLGARVPDAVGAQALSLRLVLADRGVARAVHLAGSPLHYRERFVDLPLQEPSAAAEVVRTRRPVFVGSPQDYLARYGPAAAANYEAARIGSLARLPLLVEDDLVGLLSVGYWECTGFPPEERLFLTTVADLAAQALGRAMRTERLRRLQSLSDLALSRLSLAELAADLGDRLARMLRASVVLYVHEPHRARLRPIGPHGTPIPLGRGVVGGAVAERRTAVVENTADLPELDEDLRRFGSLAVAPLCLHGQIVGAMVIGRDRPGPFACADVELVGEAAARVALAVDRGTAFEHQRELARVLQAALLPPVLPVIDGVRAASVHQAAGAGIDVGGDFYDVFALGDGSWLAVIGDVRGRGPAAASLTGLIRHTVHAVAAEVRDPAAILARTNAIVFQETGPEDFATVACVRLRTEPERTEIALASAGHCAPLILRQNWAVEAIETGGMLLGAFADLTLDCVHRTLHPGDVLLLHTDGLTESLGADERFGERRLREHLRGLGGASPEEIVDTLHQAVLRHSGGECEDDLAMLALGTVPAGYGEAVQLLEHAMVNTPQAAAEARRAVGALAESVGADLLEDLRLVVSELVANAVRHGQPGHDVVLRVVAQGSRLRVEVRNTGAPFVVPDPAEPTAESGRGLGLVRAYTARLGVGRERGRVLVWCEFDRPVH